MGRGDYNKGYKKSQANHREKQGKNKQKTIKN